MAKILNTKLYRTIGMPFSYKQFYQEYLTELLDNTIILDSLDPTEEENLQKAVFKFIKCGPSMGFSAKQYAYEALDIAIRGLGANNAVPAEDVTKLNNSLLNVIRYVGLEGEGDFNFQKAVFDTSEIISKIIGETTAVLPSLLGAVLSIDLFDGGSGFTASQTGLTLDFFSSESDDSTPGTVDVDTNGSGEVISGTYSVATGGDGFAVGQIILLDDPGNPSATPALAQVISVS